LLAQTFYTKGVQAAQLFSVILVTKALFIVCTWWISGLELVAKNCSLGGRENIRAGFVT
jgi:hypothetical protein